MAKNTVEAEIDFDAAIDCNPDLQLLPELDDGDVTDSDDEEHEWAAHECESGWEPPLVVNYESDTDPKSTSYHSPSPPWLLQQQILATLQTRLHVIDAWLTSFTVP
jgi:hypothetical protein